MIKENIKALRDEILSLCSHLNRQPQEITIVAVSKGRSVKEIEEAVEAGIVDIGENKVQEAAIKYRKSVTTHQPSAIRWHMVGHLQTNKVKEAVKIFDLIQSVDSLRLAEEINKQTERINKIQDILIEVKTSPEATKFGVRPEDTVGFIKEISALENLNLKGLMTIAPIVDNPEKTRPYFKMLRELRDKVNSLHLIPYPLHILSMGMTDDYKIAIEEGSNMIRLGRAIFGR